MNKKFAQMSAAVTAWSQVRRRTILYIGVVLAGSLVAVTVSLGLQVNDYHRVHNAETQARDRATQLLADVLSYDFNTVDTHFHDVLSSLAGDLRGNFDSVSREVIIPSAKERHVVTSAEVVESSVVSASADTVTLLLFVNQSTTSTDSPAPKLDGSRVRVAMAEQDGTWVMTEMTPV